MVRHKNQNANKKTTATLIKHFYESMNCDIYCATKDFEKSNKLTSSNNFDLTQFMKNDLKQSNELLDDNSLNNNNNNNNDNMFGGGRESLCNKTQRTKLENIYYIRKDIFISYSLSF